MIERKVLKSKAKNVLKTKYSLLLAAATVMWFLGGTGITPSIDYTNLVANIRFLGMNISVDFYKAISMLPIITMVGLMWAVFISGPLSIGLSSVNLNANAGDGKLRDVFNPFRVNYKKNITVMLMVGVKVFLWTLLLIIPGIIKAISLSFVQYIVVENPDMEASEILKLSERMTDGYKLDLVMLRLSFVLWHILAYATFVITLGTSVILLAPYTYATDAQAYLYIKAKYQNSNNEPLKVN